MLRAQGAVLIVLAILASNWVLATRVLGQGRSTLIDGQFGENTLVIHMSPEARRDAEAGVEVQIPEPHRIDRQFADEMRNWKTNWTANATLPPAGIYGDPPGDDAIQAFSDLADLNGKSSLSFFQKRKLRAATDKANQFLKENAESKRQVDLAAATQYEQLKSAFRTDPDFTFDDARRVIKFQGSGQMLGLKSVGATQSVAAGIVNLRNLASDHVRKTDVNMGSLTNFQIIQNAFGDAQWQRDYPQMLDRAFNYSIYHDYKRFDQLKVAESISAKLATIPDAGDGPNTLKQKWIGAIESVSNGMILSERHDRPVTREFLTDNLADLRRQGVDTIYLENFSTEVQSAVDAYVSKGEAISPKLEKTLASMESGDPSRSLRRLLDAARTQGMRVRCLNDPLAERFDPRLANADESLISRAARQNFLAAERIRFDPDRKGKYVALVGEAHANTHVGGIPGLSQLLDAPAVKLNDSGPVQLEVLPENKLNRELADVVKRPLPALAKKTSPRLPRNVKTPGEFVDAIRQQLSSLDSVDGQRRFAMEVQQMPDARKSLVPFDEVAERITDPLSARLLLAAAPAEPGQLRQVDQVWSGETDRTKAIAAGLNRLSMIDRVQQIRDLIRLKTGGPGEGNAKGLETFLNSEMPDNAGLQHRFLTDLQTEITGLDSAQLGNLAFEIQSGGDPKELRRFALKSLGGAAEASPAAELRELISDDPETAKRAWLNAMPDLATAEFGMGLEDIGDLVRTQKLLADAPRMMELLEPLNRSIRDMVELNRKLKGNLTPEQERSLAVKALGTYLSKKEAEHGLSQTRVLPLGVLPADVFLKLPALGYVAKDPGAGIAHGEFTHRLQWHAIMESFDRELSQQAALDPEAKKMTWRRTPYELYTGIGKRDMLANAHGRETLLSWQRPKSAWALLMDQQGSAPGEGFRHPDTMEATLSGITTYAAVAEGRLPELTHLSMAVRERHEKRVAKVNQLREQYLSLETPEKRAAFLKARGVDPANANFSRVFETMAADDYNLKKMNSQDYELFDPSRPNEKLLIRKGQPKSIEAQTELVAWHLREKIFELPLLPDQQARKAAPRIEDARMKAVLAQHLADRPVARQNPVRPAVEHQYDEIPAELRRKSFRRLSGTYDNYSSLRYSPEIRPPNPLVVPGYDEIPAELRARDSIAQHGTSPPDGDGPASASTSSSSANLPTYDADSRFSRPVSETWTSRQGDAASNLTLNEGIANRRMLTNDLVKNRRTTAGKPNQKNVFSRKAGNSRAIASQANRRNFQPASRSKSNSKPPARKPGTPFKK